MLARKIFMIAGLSLMASCSQPVKTTVKQEKSPAAKAAKKKPVEPRVTVAVAPLAISDPASAWIGDAIAENINQRIFARDDLGSYTIRQVVAAMGQAQVETKDLLKPEAGQHLARHLGARFLVVGELTVTDGKLTGEARILELASGEIKATASIDTTLAELAKLNDGLATRLAGVIGGKLPGAQAAPPDPEALQATTRALMLLRPQSLSPRAANPKVVLQLAKDRLSEARRLAESAIAKAPKLTAALVALALVEAMGGHTQKAQKLLDQASAQQANDAPLTILAKNFVFMREGRYDEAEKLLRAALNRQPGFLHGRGSLAELLLHFGRLRESRAAYQQYLELAPDQPWVMAKIAYTNAKLGKAELAVEQTQKAVAIVPKSTYLLTELASRQIDAEDLAGAHKTLERVLSIAPTHVRAQVRLGYVQLMGKDEAAAIASSLKAIEIAKGPRLRRERAYAHLNLARAYGHQGKIDQSIEHLKAVWREADISLDEFDLDPALEAVRKDPRYEKIFE
jgi:tetratricopeptide (TPR) repeat protein